MLAASNKAPHEETSVSASASVLVRHSRHGNPSSSLNTRVPGAGSTLSSTPSYAALQDSSRVSIRSVLKRTSQESSKVSLRVSPGIINQVSSRDSSPLTEQSDEESVTRATSKPLQDKPTQQSISKPLPLNSSTHIANEEQAKQVINTATFSQDSRHVRGGIPEPTADTSRSRTNIKAKRPTSSRPASMTAEPPRKKAKLVDALPGTIEPQSGSCITTRYTNTRRCVACISKKTGEPCRFKGIRAFKVSDSGKPDGPPIWYGLEESVDDANMKPVFNEMWYRKTEPDHIKRVKMSVARVLLPVLREERKRLVGRELEAIRRKREMDVRVTCDRCLTSIFATSFLCTRCGREICLDCYSMLESLDLSNTKETRLIICGHSGKGESHKASNFLPVCRFDPEQLDNTMGDMERLLQDSQDPCDETMTEDMVQVAAQLQQILDHRRAAEKRALDELEVAKSAVVEPWLESTSAESPLESHNSSDSSLTPLESDSGTSYCKQRRPKVPDHHTSIVPTVGICETSVPASSSESPVNIPSLPYKECPHPELTEEMFRSFWRKGDTMVITGLLDKMEIKWTPEYFIEHYGSQECSITDCDNEMKHESTVAQFFSQFGQYEHRGTQIHKLKDWPPSADFKTAFPTLFNDFHRAVPAPNYTRRDGFYNIAAHFPINVVAPDMGPKMYNAFASREDGYGSTRLHMDMADAVNIMLYSTPLPGEKEGVAVWDIYPATASHHIRKFLKEEFPLESSPVKYVDPIHSQYFYLTPTLRKKLYDRYKVRSWRIYQKPGDAVFIPAGCAHQVCNLADCIKVAVDFVSPENLDRCGQLTKEFRNENDKVIWKEDILQLSNMCWSAWENTRRLERAGAESDAIPA